MLGQQRGWKRQSDARISPKTDHTPHPNCLKYYRYIYIKSSKVWDHLIPSPLGLKYIINEDPAKAKASRAHIATRKERANGQPGQFSAI